jgi:hypothetical protein
MKKIKYFFGRIVCAFVGCDQFEAVGRGLDFEGLGTEEMKIIECTVYRCIVCGRVKPGNYGEIDYE